jgi:hypothetical protein
VRRALVFLAVVVAWTPFKLESFEGTSGWLAAMAGSAGLGSVGLEPALGAAFFLALVWLPPLLPVEHPRFRTRELAAVALLFLVSLTVGYGRLEPTPFLYFRF